ncbi:metallopeptidase family protein [Sphingomonas sp. Leaf10]|uniref:metallopeptidase family protein n=1 Tax=Sphingomonas sp. Leaf10 TaxID=1735676 RepID=UPI0006FA9EB6|nr:metallopeptidase family protein [Sphingomonas sp. Leaf10]KQM35960.1 neutral zinc metallopeptidase [Sphingomonas sp. Leaf10]
MSDQARTAPSAAEMEALARAALARILEPFAGHLSDIVLLVEEFADDETLAAMEMEPYELTGLYHGSPIGEKSMFDGMRLPDRIHLYRQPLLAEWCETGVDLGDLIRHVVVHEVGHHFGLSDDDMRALEDAD